MVFYLVPIFFAEKGYFSLIRPGLKIENLRYICRVSLDINLLKAGGLFSTESISSSEMNLANLTNLAKMFTF